MRLQDARPPVFGAFAEMSSDVEALADLIAPASTSSEGTTVTSITVYCARYVSAFDSMEP